MLKKFFIFIKTHLGLVYLFLAGFITLLVIASVLTRPQPETAILVQKYQDEEISLGDSLESIESKGYTKISQTETSFGTVIAYSSKKNQNLSLTVTFQNNRVVEIRHPVTLEQNLSLPQVQPFFEGENTLSYFFSNEENMKLFVSVRSGLAFKNHEFTKNINEMWVFQPEDLSALLSRHPELTSTEPAETENNFEIENQAHSYPQFFATLEEASRSATPSPTSTTL